VLKNFR